MKLNLIMPMGGGGTRFLNNGFETPKPLIEIYGKPFFFWAAQSVAKFVGLQSLTFVVLKDHAERFGIAERIKEYYPEANIRIIPEILPGAVLTCAEGIKDIPDGVPILFNDCDHLFICKEFNRFCKEEKFGGIDGGLLTFTSNDPRFSFVELGSDRFVKRTVEKQAISSDAICGAYYFKDKETFEDAEKVYLEHCAYKEFFISGVYNVLTQDEKKIAIFHTDSHVSFGTPDEYESAQGDDTWNELI